MNLADFRLAIPQQLIAQVPVARGRSRLLDVTAQPFAHIHTGDFSDLLRPGDLLVFNNTKVVKARLRGEKDTGGQAGVLVERVFECEALCQVRVSKPLKAGRKLRIAGQEISILGREGEFYRLGFPRPVFEFLEQYGQVPLPPYIERETEQTDTEAYQTVFAKIPGAVAAPTAGLHFSDEMLRSYTEAGIEIAYVTLHIGAGTFQPVRVKDLSKHQMHKEQYSINQKTVDAINACKARGGRIIAVGTTVVRTLEAAVSPGCDLRSGSDDTRLFITPGYRFQIVDALFTNFHLSESTLLMLVSAFAGYEKIMAAYQEAIRLEYRFFSYGDALFCEKEACGVSREI